MAVAPMTTEQHECLTCPGGHSGPSQPCVRCNLLPPAPHRTWPGGANAMMVDGEWAVLMVQVSWLKRTGHVSLCPACLAATVAANFAQRHGTIPAAFKLRRVQPGQAAASPFTPPDEDDDDDEEDESRRR